MNAPTPVPAVPRPAATVMLLRDEADELEVLLLRRAARTPFVPGAHVFPGGALEAGDGSPEVAAVAPGRTDLAASTTLGVAGGGLAYWVAAVRECLEEAGMLLAVDGDGAPVDPGAPVLSQLDRLRVDVENDRLALADLYRRFELQIPVESIAYVSHWVTPEQSPRRYDTRFFAMATPPGQVVSPDRWEAVDAEWLNPARALDHHGEGTIDLIAPTIANLELLASFASVSEAMAALLHGEQRTDRVVDRRGGLRVPLPAEPPPNHRTPPVGPAEVERARDE